LRTQSETADLFINNKVISRSGLSVVIPIIATRPVDKLELVSRQRCDLDHTVQAPALDKRWCLLLKIQPVIISNSEIQLFNVGCLYSLKEII